MATVSVRYIVDDVEESIAFYTGRLGFSVELNPPPGFAVLSRGDLRLLLNEPGAGGAGQPTPVGRGAGAASRSCSRIPPATPSSFSNPQGTNAPHKCYLRQPAKD